jgi:hypothetical protein
MLVSSYESRSELDRSKALYYVNGQTVQHRHTRVFRRIMSDLRWLSYFLLL